jgi:hypothetical protein
VGKQWAAFLAVGALVAGACGTSKSDARGETPSHPGVVLTTPTTRSSSTTTSTTVPAYSFDDSVPPPKLVNTGTEYVAILKSLLDYGDWTTAYEPSPDVVDRFITPGTKLHAAYVKTLTTLSNRGQRYIEVRAGDDKYKGRKPNHRRVLR